ncbi:MAG: putative Transposon Ty3-G Gag-Pol polyprotein, partial [Streblomastix strix]
KRQMQPHLLKTSPQNTPKATRPVQDLRNRNKVVTPKIRQKQSPTPRLTSRNSWTEQERKEERREGRDLENHETDNEDSEILDRNGRTNSEKFGTTRINQLDILQLIRIYSPMGLEEEAKKYKITQEDQLKENIVVSIRKEQIKWYNQTFMIKKAYEKCRKIFDAKALNKLIADFHFKRHDSNEMKQTIKLGDWSTSLDLSSAFHHLIVQSESQPYLAFEFQNNYYTYRAMPFGTKHSPIFFATAMEPLMQQIRMKTDIRIINYVDDILLLHQNKEYLKNMTQNVIETLIYFGFTMNTENSETEPNQTEIFLGWEWNLAKQTVKTKPKKRLLLLYDLYKTRRWIKKGTQITAKQTAKQIGKLNYLRLYFQEA